MSEPLVSIIMSVYNGEHFLTEAIESLLNQTYSNLEIIIANDGSTDNSGNILRKYASIDRRIKIYNNKIKMGLTKTLNKLIDETHGKYIARMDSDDVSKLNRIEEEVYVSEKNNCDIVFSNCNLIDYNSNFLCMAYKPKSIEKILNLMPIYNYIPHPSVLMKKETVIEVGKYDEKFIKGQDQALWLKFIKKGKSFYFIDKTLIDYRINPDSVRGERSDNYEYELLKTFLANGKKIKAFKYIFKIHNFKLTIESLIRLLIPFRLYRFLIICKAKRKQQIG